VNVSTAHSAVRLVTLAAGDSTVRAFFPDGSVSIEHYSVETGVTESSAAQLSAEDLDELTRQINGTSLRLQLAEPEPCSTGLSTPGDGRRDDAVDLYLSDGSTSQSPALSKNVTSCDSFTSLIDLVDRY
jgi:hypothetical protein